ncbi:MAG: alpha/beta hydrolase domain-containing protein, partial [Chloroflexota bacterium]
MAVVGIEIKSRQPLADGQAFGAAGAYERIDGTVRFAVDPAHQANAAIVDLDKAARDAEGRVHFSADFCILQPADAARDSGRLLFEVANRGRRLIPRQINRAPNSEAPTEEIDPGDGFLMRHGWTVAWCGWQWDVVPGPGLVGLEAPQALGPDGQPLNGRIAVEFQPNATAADKLLANRIHRPYPVADLNDPDAVLSVREWPGGPKTVIPREQWTFGRDEHGSPAPDPAYIWLEGGFEAGKVYEIVYTTNTCPVVGTGLLAVRDFSAFLHHGTTAEGNPCAGRIQRAYGYGVSQSGRFLRHFLYQGLNVDEAGRQVFDGVMPQVAGGRRGQFNHRFAQPSDQSTPSFGHLMPFTDEPQSDPLTGESGGLLDRLRQVGGMPKVMAINTSAEYWRGDCSLIHTDIMGTSDVAAPENVRQYLFAGTQHGPGSVPLQRVNAADGATGAHGFNAVDYSPLTRAALLNLDAWVSEGVEPPVPIVPRIGDGTAVRHDAVLEQFRAIPGATVPDGTRLLSVFRTGLGPEADQGVATLPVTLGERYQNVVSQVDADLNEVGGIRLPDLTVPLASFTGWNPRASETGGSGQILSMQGSTLPFPSTRAERERTGDPRPSIEERYRDRDDYLAQVRAAAERLVEQRYLLAEDLESVVA